MCGPYVLRVTAEQLIQATAAHVREQMTTEGSHDWWHIQRVWNNARHIAASEPVDLLVVELGALLHDLDDWKYADGDFTAASRATRRWLESLNAPAEVVDHVADIVGRVTFKGAGVPDEMPTLEGKVVQDADRLDAIGAIGIARTFAFGGSKSRPLHIPDQTVELHDSVEAYIAGVGQTTVAHFHEKLLLLRDRMHTATARRIADERHAYMQQFLERFDAEWHGHA